jgi:hypothetical protein
LPLTTGAKAATILTLRITNDFSLASIKDYIKGIGGIEIIESSSQHTASIAKVREAVEAQFDQWADDARKAAKKDGNDFWLSADLATNQFEKIRILKIIDAALATPQVQSKEGAT